MQLSRFIEISAEIKNIRLISEQMISEIYKVSNDSDLTFRIDVAVTEAVANSIKHGSQSKNDKIKISYTVKGNDYIFRISDQGQGPVDDIFDSPKLSKDKMIESKRGAYIIFWAADEIQQEVNEDGYTLTLKFCAHDTTSDTSD